MGPPQRRSGSVPRQHAQVARRSDSRPKPERPAWDDTRGDLDKWKLTPEQLNKRRAQRISKNRITVDAIRHSSVDLSPGWDDHSDRTTADTQPQTSDGGASINYGAVLQMLQRPHQQAACVSRPSSPPPPPKSFEEQAAEAAAAMAEAASRLPLDITLNPRSRLFGLSTPQEEQSPAARSAPSDTPGSNTHSTHNQRQQRQEEPHHHHQQQQQQAVPAERTAAASVLSASAASALVERQQQLEARLDRLEVSTTGDTEGLRRQLGGALEELRQLKEESGDIRRELAEFSRHTSTLMTFIHTQVLQLLAAQGMQPELPALSPPHTSDSEGRSDPSDGSRMQAPGARQAPAVAAPSEAGAGTQGGDQGVSQQQGRASSDSPEGAWARGRLDVDQGAVGSWMFAGQGEDEGRSPGISLGWGGAAAGAERRGAASDWGGATMPGRSIFQDLPSDPPLPSPSMPQRPASSLWPPRAHPANPASAPSPSMPQPTASAPQGFSTLGLDAPSATKQWPVKDIEQDLEVLPSYAAFRRSTVTKAVRAAAAGAPVGVTGGAPVPVGGGPAPAGAPAPSARAEAGRTTADTGAPAAALAPLAPPAAPSQTPVAPGRVRVALAHTTAGPAGSCRASLTPGWGQAVPAAHAFQPIGDSFATTTGVHGIPNPATASGRADAIPGGRTPWASSQEPGVGSVGVGLWGGGVGGTLTSSVDALQGGAGGSSQIGGLHLRQLPTEFQPRNLGHASIMVQSHLGQWMDSGAAGDGGVAWEGGDTGKGGQGHGDTGGGDASAQVAVGTGRGGAAPARGERVTGARRGIAWEVSAESDDDGYAAAFKGAAGPQEAAGSFWAGQPAIGAEVLGLASPKHAASGAYMSLAAHVAAGQRTKGRRVSPC